MRIDNTYLKNLDPQQPAGSGAARSAEARQATSTANSLQATSQHFPSPELLRYLENLRTTPDVRAEEVARAAARLRHGDYSTPDAAQQTAQAILQAAE